MCLTEKGDVCMVKCEGCTDMAPIDVVKIDGVLLCEECRINGTERPIPGFQLRDGSYPMEEGEESNVRSAA